MSTKKSRGVMGFEPNNGSLASICCRVHLPLVLSGSGMLFGLMDEPAG